MTDPSKRPTCGSCNCYRPDPAQLLRGFCECLPPTPILVAQPGASNPGLMSVFPPVTIDNFCHQWRPRPDAVAQPAANDPPVLQPPAILPSLEP